jgi:hypothetical protein
MVGDGRIGLIRLPLICLRYFNNISAKESYMEEKQLSLSNSTTGNRNMANVQSFLWLMVVLSLLHKNTLGLPWTVPVGQ